jgi:hypothetical protein
MVVVGDRRNEQVWIGCGFVVLNFHDIDVPLMLDLHLNEGAP